MERTGFELLKITRPEKVLYPNDGITKGQLVDYYERVAPAILPYLNDRPLYLERCPDGIAGQCFLQKKAGPRLPDWIHTVPIARANGTVVRHISCNDAATLIWLASQAVITPHTWLSRFDKPTFPDLLIFDIDPPADDFKGVCETAKKLRDLLKAHELISFVKTTASRGLQVAVFLEGSDDFEDVRAFARVIARQLAADDPEHLTTEVRKNKRGDRIFLDTARNAYGKTAVPPYALGARDGAPVAAPLLWEELEEPAVRPTQFNIRNVFERLNTLGDPWKTRRPQRLPRDG